MPTSSESCKREARERGVFDFSNDAQANPGGELVARVLTHAETLRLGARAEKGA